MNAVSYEWDFCLSDIQNFKQSAQVATVPGLASGTHYKLLQAEGAWFAFVSSYENNKIYRVDFGDDLNNDPTVTDLGNFGGLIVEPYSIDVGFSNGEWYGFVGSLQTNYGVIKLKFGATLNSIPLATNIGNFSLATNYIDLQILHQGANSILALVANGVTDGGNGSFVTINFGSSFDNTPSSVVTTPIPDAGNTLRGFEIINKQGNWIGIFSSSIGSKLIKLEFGNNIQSLTPAATTFTFSSVSVPFDVNVIQEGSKYYAIVGNLSANISIINFGNLEVTDIPVELTNTSLPVLFSVAAVRSNGKTFVQGASYLTNKIHHITFEDVCNASQSVSYTQVPAPISFTEAGTHEIELIVTSVNGEKSITGKSVSISTNVAPDIVFSTDQSICTSTPVAFTAINNDGTVNSYSWNYGDATSGTGSSSQHTYTAGSYSPRLDVTAINGCVNFATGEIVIYSSPSASFALPTGLICTNNEFTFSNNTVDNFDGNLIYQWSVDAVPVSSTRNLLYTFTTGGSKDITLQTSIPGCSDETTQTVASVGVGPMVDFTISGKCQNETISIENNSTGSIAGYTWDFGNGQNSTQEEPTFNYSTNGIYPIELAVTGTNSCVSTKVINHQIYSAPQPDFTIDLPPFSCSGSSTNFTDLTPVLIDSNLETWLWNFDDQGATSFDQAPQHTYAVGGDYNVSLTVTSDQLCVNTSIKTITISPAPSPVISNTPACENTDVAFSDGSGAAATEWMWQVDDSFYFTQVPSHIFSESGDYLVSLTLTAANGCIGTDMKQITVPISPVFDFTSEGKCEGTEATFIATVTTTSDPVVDFTWQFDGNETQGSPTIYIFQTVGLHEAQLVLTTASGCEYSLNKAVTVLSAPVADFSFSPESGQPPLQIQFTNLSVNATSSQWTFNDPSNATSNQTSPSFTFTELGDYPVDLHVSNAEGCGNTISKLINVEVPIVDISITNLMVQENTDGTLGVFITIENEGNTPAQDLPIEMELSNGTRFREIVDEPINGGQTLLYQFNTAIFKSADLRYLCTSISITGNAANAQQSLCKSFENFTVINAPYPNPANDQLTVDWVSATDETVRSLTSKANKF